jgi:hypothetical protein
MQIPQSVCPIVHLRRALPAPARQRIDNARQLYNHYYDNFIYI